jgi:hypothetical protein
MLFKNRKYILVIGDRRNGIAKEISELQITFSVENSINNKDKSNKAQITIVNLSDDTIKLLDNDYISLVLSCGYEELGLDTILVGNATKITTQKQGTDKITTIDVSETYDNLNSVKIHSTVAPSNTVSSALEMIRQSMPDVVRGSYRGSGVKAILPYGLPMNGSPKQMLDTLARTYRLQWQVKNQVLYVADEGQAYVADTNQAVKFSVNSGLIDSPYIEVDTQGKSKKDKTKRKSLKFKALLNPFVKAGDVVYVESELNTGFYKIREITYTGDYRGTSWYIECSADIIKEGDFST